MGSSQIRADRIGFHAVGLDCIGLGQIGWDRIQLDRNWVGIGSDRDGLGVNLRILRKLRLL